MFFNIEKCLFMKSISNEKLKPTFKTASAMNMQYACSKQFNLQTILDSF